jgi:hypothetical protein
LAAITGWLSETCEVAKHVMFRVIAAIAAAQV